MTDTVTETMAAQDFPVATADIVAHDRASGRRTMLCRSTGRFVALGSREFGILELLDGSSSLIQLEMATPLPLDQLQRLIEQFRAIGLVAGNSSERADRRQLEIDPSRWLPRPGRHRPVSRKRRSRIVWTFVALFTGLVTALTWTRLWECLHTTTPSLATILVLAGSMVTSVILHELAHGTALTRRGGRVPRIGLKFAGLLPYAFCDVTDSWRLRPHQRIAVALAGAGAHARLAVTHLVAFSFIGLNLGDQVAAYLAWASIGNLVAGMGNLVPLGDSDGSLAIDFAVNRPRFSRTAEIRARQRALGALWSWSGSKITPAVETKASLAYGWFRLVTPPLVLVLVLLCQPLFLSWGRIGLVVELMALGVITGKAIRLFTRLLGLFRRFKGRAQTVLATSALSTLAVLCLPVLPGSGLSASVAGSAAVHRVLPVVDALSKLITTGGRL